jgi:hypothetical protein
MELSFTPQTYIQKLTCQSPQRRSATHLLPPLRHKRHKLYRHPYFHIATYRGHKSSPQLNVTIWMSRRRNSPDSKNYSKPVRCKMVVFINGRSIRSGNIVGGGGAVSGVPKLSCQSC